MPTRLLPVLAIHVLACLWIAFTGWRDPLGNWDIVPYTALVHAAGDMPAAELSKRAYDDVKNYLGDAKFRPLVTSDGADPGKAYQVIVHRDPAALVDNLRFYSVKPLYVWLARAATLLTGNAASAVVLVSSAAFGAVLAVFPFFFRHKLLAMALLWALVLAGEAPIAAIRAAATPDSLALLFVVCAALSVQRRAHPVAVALLCALALLARPDAGFIIAPLLFGMAWLQRREGRGPALLACLAGVLGLFLMLGLRALPWSTLFHHTFVALQAFPSRLAAQVTPAQYLGVVQQSLPHALSARVVLFLAAGVLLAIVPWLRARSLTGFQWMAACAVAGIVLHFLVFPIASFDHERMFLGSYFLILAAALLAVEERRA